MNDETVIEYLEQTRDFLENAINLSKIEAYTRQFSKESIFDTDFFLTHCQVLPNTQEDKGAKWLLPPDCNLICYKSTEDGNCLFNSVSLLIIGNEEKSMQLRFATIIELMKYARHYLNIPIFKKSIIYSDLAFQTAEKFNDKEKEFDKQFVFIQELHLMCNIGNWCGMPAIYGLSSVLQHKIRSIFPPIKQKLLIDTYNKLILPRQDSDNGSQLETNRNSQEIDCESQQQNSDYEPINILWTNMSVTNKQKATKFLKSNLICTNHFVPCHKAQT
ncbi:3522_t:CDS:1 [Diversispora eburnea]|uniref:Vertnin n=1 Tax=Diversispora eburnea TaxID=1213867 RepID=A0A9N9C8T2_9GLOM|nr:3522_t:CDS:1 [Diversispora eburnea]